MQFYIHYDENNLIPVKFDKGISKYEKNKRVRRNKRGRTFGASNVVA